jgi:hypothetical protein
MLIVLFNLEVFDSPRLLDCGALGYPGRRPRSLG